MLYVCCKYLEFTYSKYQCNYRYYFGYQFYTQAARAQSSGLRFKKRRTIHVVSSCIAFSICVGSDTTEKSLCYQLLLLLILLDELGGQLLAMYHHQNTRVFVFDSWQDQFESDFSQIGPGLLVGFSSTGNVLV